MINYALKNELEEINILNSQLKLNVENNINVKYVLNEKMKIKNILMFSFILLLFFTITLFYEQKFENKEVFWVNAYTISPNSDIANAMVGGLLLERGLYK